VIPWLTSPSWGGSRTESESTSTEVFLPRRLILKKRKGYNVPINFHRNELRIKKPQKSRKSPLRLGHAPSGNSLFLI
jgi:hypothetical protein